MVGEPPHTVGRIFKELARLSGSAKWFPLQLRKVAPELVRWQGLAKVVQGFGASMSDSVAEGQQLAV